MTAHEKLKKFAEKQGLVVSTKVKVKLKKADVTTAKQKDLLIEIAQDLGYVEKV
jgi:hypothetical protein